MKFRVPYPALLLILLVLASCDSKVTDPSDPRFEPDRFSFRDYETHEELTDAFRKLFPPGTSKEFVERVLVKAGGIERYGCRDWNNYCSYRYPQYMQDMKGGARVSFLFDQQNRIIRGGFHDDFYAHLKMADQQARREKGNDR